MNAAPVLRIATRGSRLALAQAGIVSAALSALGASSEMVIVETEGDRRAPDTAWGEGAFVAAIERALLDGLADLAVHSAKDLPTEEDLLLRVAAYMPRAEPSDALVTRHGGQRLATLAAGIRVGTDSPRRAGFLLAARPDLHVVPLSGNVDTRLRRLDAGQVDALILAAAGLDRLGLRDRIDQVLDASDIPPAPGQGALAVQARADRPDLIARLEMLDDRTTRIAVTAERAFLHAAGGGCRAPIGALGRVDGDRLTLIGGVVGPDGSDPRRAEIDGSAHEPETVGRALAAKLPRVRFGDHQATEPQRASARVLVPRATAQAAPLSDALHDRGLTAIAVPAVEIVPTDGVSLASAVSELPGGHWLVVTSSNGARASLAAFQRAGRPTSAVRWAAVGHATATVLETAGVAVTYVSTGGGSAALARELPIRQHDRVLLARGDLADSALPGILGRRGAVVTDVVAYRTREAPESSVAALGHLLATEPPDAVVLTSGSTARGLAALAVASGTQDRLRAIPAVCIGPSTAAEARRLGFAVAAQADRPSLDSVAALVADLVTYARWEPP